MDKTRLQNLLGLAYRAKKIIIGSEPTIENIKAKKICLVIMDKELTSDSSRQIKNKCEFYSIPIIDLLSSQEISKSIGKENIRVIGLIDEGFKKSIMNLQ